MTDIWTYLPLVLMLVMLLLKTPVIYAILFPTLLYFLFGQTMSPSMMIVQRICTTMESFTYLALPFFTLAGVIFNYAGITRRLLNLADMMVGHLKGGLAHVNILLSAMMGGLSGSCLADASMQAKILVPEMTKLGYDKGFSCAVTAPSSVITTIIPPGIMLIMNATSANVSVQKIFMAGVIPGIMLTVALMITAGIISHKKNYVGSRTHFAGMRAVLKELVDSIWALLVPFGLLIGLRCGMFTATEGGAICAVYALIVGMFVYKEIKVKDLIPIIMETIEASAGLMMLLAAAQSLGRYLTWESIPMKVSEALTHTFTTPGLYLLAVNLLLLVVGCFFDGGAAMVLVAPLLAPAAELMGIDPIHFGIVMTVNLTLGGVTPPFGTMMFVTCQITDTKLERFIKAVIPLFLSEVAVLFICTYVPGIVTFLPNLMS